MSAGRAVTTTLALAAGAAWVGLALAWGGAPEPRSGHVHWNAWEFTWELSDSQGLRLHQVTFDGRPVLHEASLPVIRVGSLETGSRWHPSEWWPLKELSEASPGVRCGPFQQRIGWSRIRPVPSCGDGRVCIDSYFSGHVEWLELGVLAELGTQRVYQAWYVSEDGQITAGLQTRGQPCRTAHAHHVYWRFTFVDDEPGGYEVFAHDDTSAPSPWGPGWVRYREETDALRNAETNRSWLVRHRRTQSGVWILPGPRDGAPDGFSDRDLAIRVHREAEHGTWIFGAREDLGFEDGEALDQAGLDVWYIAHVRQPDGDAAPDAPPIVGPTLRLHP